MKDVKVTGEALSEPIHWTGRQWAVTAHGIEARDGTYEISKKRLWESNEGYGWEQHMAEKDWVDMDDFLQALSVGRRHYVDLKPH